MKDKTTIMIITRRAGSIVSQIRLCAYCYQEVNYRDDYCLQCGRKFLMESIGDQFDRRKRYAKEGELWE